MLLLNGDCIEQMQKLKDEGKQIDSVVTDPPYHLTSIVKRFGKEGSAPAQYGTDEFLKILNTLSGENVFVISHKQDALADKFRETIKFEKIRNFSHVAT